MKWNTWNIVLHEPWKGEVSVRNMECIKMEMPDRVLSSQWNYNVKVRESSNGENEHNGVVFCGLYHCNLQVENWMLRCTAMSACIWKGSVCIRENTKLKSFSLLCLYVQEAVYSMGQKSIIQFPSLAGLKWWSPRNLVFCVVSAFLNILRLEFCPKGSTTCSFSVFKYAKRLRMQLKPRQRYRTTM